MATVHLAVKAPPLRQQVQGTDRLANVALLGTVALLCIGLLAPLLLILSKALDAPQGGTASGTGAFTAYLASPALLQSLWHSVWVSLLVTAIVVEIVMLYSGTGFIPASTVLFAFAARAFGQTTHLLNLAIGAVMSGLLFLLFRYGLGLALPSGPLERIIDQILR